MNKNCQECGIEFVDETRGRHKKFCTSNCQQKYWLVKHPKRVLIKRAKYRSTRKGYEFNLIEEDIPDIPSHCPVLGIPITMNTHKGSGLHANSLSLNRIDPKKGYIKNNIEIISQRANHLLSDATVEELEKVINHARHSRH